MSPRVCYATGCIDRQTRFAQLRSNVLPKASHHHVYNRAPVVKIEN